jgi:ABC-type amino acid transport substrate-binding protein
MTAMDDAPTRKAAADQPSRRRLLRRMSRATVPALLLPIVHVAIAGQRFHTLTPDVLHIGTYFVNPPFEFVSDRRRVGFEVDLMNDVARRLGLLTEFVDTRWEVILREMQDNRYDCIVGGITITPDRQRSLAWSVPYMTTTLSLIIDATRSPAIKTVSDLKSATVGVQAATTDYDAAIAMQRVGQIGSVKVYQFARIADAMADLSAGRITAVMKVYPVAAWLARRTPGLRILASVPDDPQPLGIGFSRGNPDLVSAVDNTLAAMQRDGSYSKLTRQWDVA